MSYFAFQLSWPRVWLKIEGSVGRQSFSPREIVGIAHTPPLLGSWYPLWPIGGGWKVLGQMAKSLTESRLTYWGGDFMSCWLTEWLAEARPHAIAFRFHCQLTLFVAICLLWCRRRFKLQLQLLLHRLDCIFTDWRVDWMGWQWVTGGRWCPTGLRSLLNSAGCLFYGPVATAYCFRFAPMMQRVPVFPEERQQLFVVYGQSFWALRLLQVNAANCNCCNLVRFMCVWPAGWAIADPLPLPLINCHRKLIST